MEQLLGVKTTTSTIHDYSNSRNNSPYVPILSAYLQEGRWGSPPHIAEERQYKSTSLDSANHFGCRHGTRILGVTEKLHCRVVLFPALSFSAVAGEMKC